MNDWRVLIWIVLAIYALDPVIWNPNFHLCWEKWNQHVMVWLLWFLRAGADTSDEVAWYILGENKQNLGPYAFSELRGELMCFHAQLRILLMTLAYWYIQLVVLFLGFSLPPSYLWILLLEFQLYWSNLHDELDNLDLFTWRGQSISWMDTSLKIRCCGLREEVIGNHYLQSPSFRQPHLSQ